MRNSRSLIRLADNPFGDEEMAPPGGDLGGDLGDGMGGGMDEDPFGEEGEDEMGGGGMYEMRKGRRVRGPRMKLSASDTLRLSNIEKAVADLAETVASLAQSTSFVGKAVLSRLRKDWDEDKDDDDEKEDKAKVGKAKVRKADYESDTGVGGTKDVGDDRTAEEETKNETGITEGELTNARVRKDDAASSFGEKDDDMPGNKEAGIDEKDKGPEDYLIQGGAGDGPGPTSLSNAFRADLDKAVASVLASHGVIRKAQAPRTGTGAQVRGKDDEAVFADFKAMSFSDLNKIRGELGLLPRGLI